MNIIIAPMEVLTDTRLTSTERSVLFALYSFRNRNADTVWPGLEAIAQRSGFADTTSVSRVTARLSKKGWLKKRRKGFSGRVEYDLAVPEFDEQVPSVEPPKPDEIAKNVHGQIAKNVHGQIAKNVHGQIAKNKEQSNEQQKEQQERQEQHPPKDLYQDSVDESEKLSKIDYAKIVEHFNEILGTELRKVRDLTDQRRKHIRARIQDSPKRADPVWWARYFELVSFSDFLMGRGPANPATGRSWAADFDWLINPTNMTKTLERKYHVE